MATDKVWEQQFDTLWKEYGCSRYFSYGFSNRWSCPEIARSKCKGFHYLIQYCEL